MKIIKRDGREVPYDYKKYEMLSRQGLRRTSRRIRKGDKFIMTLTEQFIKDAIQIDHEAEVEYFSEAIGDGCGSCRVPYVQFTLIPTDELIRIADRIRYDEGFKPIKPINGKADYVDADGRYTFFVCICKTICRNCLHRDRLIDNCIAFMIENSDSSDNEEIHEITLTKSEQAAVRKILEAQCSKRPMKPCAVLLWESETEMIKTYENNQAERM